MGVSVATAKVIINFFITLAFGLFIGAFISLLYPTSLALIIVLFSGVFFGTFAHFDLHGDTVAEVEM